LLSNGAVMMRFWWVRWWSFALWKRGRVFDSFCHGFIEESYGEGS